MSSSKIAVAQDAETQRRKSMLLPHLPSLSNYLVKVRKSPLSHEQTAVLIEELAGAFDHYIYKEKDPASATKKAILSCAKDLNRALSKIEKMLPRHRLALPGTKQWEFQKLLLLADEQTNDLTTYNDISGDTGSEVVDGSKHVFGKLQTLEEVILWFIGVADAPAIRKMVQQPESIVRRQISFVEYLADVWHRHCGKKASTTSNPYTNAREGPFVAFVCEVAKIVDPKSTLNGACIRDVLSWLKPAENSRKNKG